MSMGSISFTEILVIALVVLIVFGPKRLPELARRAGELVAKAKEASSAVTDALGQDFSEVAEPLKGIKDDVTGIKTDLTKAVTSISEFDDTSIRMPEDEDDGAVRSDVAADAGAEDGNGKQVEPRGGSGDDLEDGTAATDTP
jgi:sec-independent protein translocase protein TatB